MDTMLFKNWWLVALRGLLALLFGVFALLFPEATILALVLYFGALTLFGGGMFLMLAFRRARHGEPWVWWLLEGVIDLIFGLLVVLYPGISIGVFVLFLAVWAMILGLVQIVNAVQLRSRFRYWWLTLLYGTLTLLFGLLLFFNPFSGVLAVTILISFFAMSYGLLLFFTGFGLRAMHRIGQKESTTLLP